MLREYQTDAAFSSLKSVSPGGRRLLSPRWLCEAKALLSTRSRMIRTLRLRSEARRTLGSLLPLIMADSDPSDRIGHRMKFGLSSGVSEIRGLMTHLGCKRPQGGLREDRIDAK
jgi:hypothetical protein